MGWCSGAGSSLPAMLPHHSPALEYAPMSAPQLNGSLPAWSNQLPQANYPPPHLNQPHPLPLPHPHPHPHPHTYAPTAPSTSNSSIGPSSTTLTTPALISPVPPISNSPHPTHSEPSPSVHSISSHPRTPGSRPPLGPQALSLAEYADVHADRHQLATAKPAGGPYAGKPEPNYPDPIEMKILGYIEAEMLFERYHTVLSSYINLTDRKCKPSIRSHRSGHSPVCADLVIQITPSNESRNSRPSFSPLC